jgi:hypothetical protein
MTRDPLLHSADARPQTLYPLHSDTAEKGCLGDLPDPGQGCAPCALYIRACASVLLDSTLHNTSLNVGFLTVRGGVFIEGPHIARRNRRLVGGRCHSHLARASAVRCRDFASERSSRFVNVTVEGTGTMKSLHQLANQLAVELGRPALVNLLTLPTQIGKSSSP